MQTTYPKATPHGHLIEIFEDIFSVTGSVIMGAGLQISRNMIVVREGRSLTLISSVRLDEEGLKALDALGDVKHVVKLGSYHLGKHNGLDDPFYVERYSAKLWAMPNMNHKEGLSTTNQLLPGGKLPFKGASMFSYETSEKPEGLLLIDKAGGILVACDSLQNWLEPDEYFSESAATLMKKVGFFDAANIGPEWFRVCEPKAKDFERLLALEFCHLLPSHGKPIINTAKQEFTVTFSRLLGI